MDVRRGLASSSKLRLSEPVPPFFKTQHQDDGEDVDEANPAAKETTGIAGPTPLADRDVKEEVADAAQFAIDSPDPAPGTIFEDVYWEVDNQTEAGQTGRHFFGD